MVSNAFLMDSIRIVHLDPTRVVYLDPTSGVTDSHAPELHRQLVLTHRGSSPNIFVEQPLQYLKIRVVFCAIWYRLYNLKNMKYTHGGVLLLVKLSKSNTLPWVFFTFFKMYKRYQMTQRITYTFVPSGKPGGFQRVVKLCKQHQY